MALVTFVIPSIGRATLRRTLASLEAQTDSSWQAIVLFDNIKPSIHATKHVRVVSSPYKLGVGKNGAGRVRNVAMRYVTTPWAAFIDDDDTLSHTYVADLRSNASRHPSLPAMIFRMCNHDGRILPPADHTMFRCCAVGISFAVRTDLWRNKRLEFSPSSVEDYDLLLRIHTMTDILLAPQVVYYVRNRRPVKTVIFPEHVIPQATS